MQYLSFQAASLPCTPPCVSYIALAPRMKPVAEEDEEEEYLGELAAREDEMDGLQDALASQR